MAANFEGEVCLVLAVLDTHNQHSYGYHIKERAHLGGSLE